MRPEPTPNSISEKEVANLDIASIAPASRQVAPSDQPERRSTATIELERLDIENRGRAQYFKLQLGWSWAIGVLLFIMVVTQIVFLSMIGASKWDFSKYENALNGFLIENCAQIIASAVIIVKYLFPKPPDSPSSQKRDASQKS